MISSEQISNNLRGYWSHFAARYVCGIFAPTLAFLSTCAILLVYPLISARGLFISPPQQTIARLVWFSVEAISIILLSYFLFSGRKNPRDEAFELEFNVIATRISRRGLYNEARIHFLKEAETKADLENLLKERVRKIINDIQKEAFEEANPSFRAELIGTKLWIYNDSNSLASSVQFERAWGRNFDWIPADNELFAQGGRSRKRDRQLSWEACPETL